MDESAMVLRDSDILDGPPLGGADEYEPLFVINLCAAMTPLNLESQAIPGFEQYKLYQVSRMEDGRRRYRLRLGFFTKESMAEDVLCSVRQRFATAFTSCLSDEDLKHASGYLKRTVQDLARTGRFKISKPRDTGATARLRALPDTSETAVMRALTPSPIIAPTREPVAPPPAATAKTPPRLAHQRVSKPADEAIELDWSPAAVTPRAPTPHPTPQLTPKFVPISASAPAVRPAVKAAAQHVAHFQQVAQAASEPLRDPTIRSTTLSETAMLRRPSLMQQAHAMATSDAKDRAKILSTLERAAEANATGKFKVPAIPQAKPAAVMAPVAKAPVANIPATTTVAAKPSAVAHSTASPGLTASTPPVVAAKPTAPKSQPFHVGAGAQIPETSLSLEGSTPAKPTAHKGTSIAAIVQPQHTAADNSLSPDLLRARELAKQSALWRQQHGEVPTLDTTQTIRTLTKLELEDEAREKWYTVQLAISDQPANLDTMPRLDIFEAYTLYSVATMDGGHIRHALRLGFFREAVSAEAVMGYLRTFFGDPVITRISDAEHERFQDAPKFHAIKPAPSIVAMEQPRTPEPTAAHAASSVPTINTVARHAAKPAPRNAGPAVKRSSTSGKKTTAKGKTKPVSSGVQQEMLNEARLLGLTDTQIIRVQKNPSLLSRLVGKLTK